MPTDRSLITLSDVVRRAAALVDPEGEDAAVVEFAGRPPEPVAAWLAQQGSSRPDAAR
jgi:hypothetical protein